MIQQMLLLVFIVFFFKVKGEGEGYIVFSRPWPGIMRTVYGDQDRLIEYTFSGMTFKTYFLSLFTKPDFSNERFEKTYFSRFPGYYMSGDGAKRDADGYLWITGRIDDMLNCSGHLMSTAQVYKKLKLMLNGDQIQA